MDAISVQQDELPSISVIIPALNEQGFIIQCLESVLSGNYPHSRLEILVVDGGSTDLTVQQVNQLAEEYDSVRLLHNPKKITPAAMNLGIANASHDILVWLGAHAIYDGNYLVQSVRVLLEENCAASGGVITPIGQTRIGQAIAVATSCKFGIGNAKYRYAKQRQSVDTVFGGCWNKADILQIGGFNEGWVRNQDYELNCRLREQIGPIILDPTIRCQYFCRETIPSLARQYYQYGFWRYRTLRQHPGSFNLRQAAPLVLLGGLLASPLVAMKSLVLGLVVPLLYLFMALLASGYETVRSGKPGDLLLLPVIFATLHLSWATGFLRSVLQSKFGKPANDD